MITVSVTRMRLRSWRHLPAFMWAAIKAQRQAGRAAGNVATSVRHANGAYWTMSAWRDDEALRGFYLRGNHREVMAHLADWSDEASLVRFEHPDGSLPSWQQAEFELAGHGRLTTVKHPSPAHAAGFTLGEWGRAAGIELAVAAK